MTNTQQRSADRTAPLRELEVRFKDASSFIRQSCPDEELGDFPSLQGIETMHHDDLEVLKVRCEWLVRSIERRADEIQSEADEAERLRAENLRRLNMSPTDARIERLERALSSLAARVTRLDGERSGRLPGLPHVPRANIPQILGQPGGMGRPAALAAIGGGVRRISSAPLPATDTPLASGWTPRYFPLNVIGGSGGR
jgi:hypothetical protein